MNSTINYNVVLSIGNWHKGRKAAVKPLENTDAESTVTKKKRKKKEKETVLAFNTRNV